MKQKDFALIAVIVFVSAIISLFASKALFGAPKAANKEAEVVAPITANFPTPDSKYFNSQSIDPTKTITIQQNTNTDPFNGAASPSN
jgi:hypothetical protein